MRRMRRCVPAAVHGRRSRRQSRCSRNRRKRSNRRNCSSRCLVVMRPRAFIQRSAATGVSSQSELASTAVALQRFRLSIPALLAVIRRRKSCRRPRCASSRKLMSRFAMQLSVCVNRSCAWQATVKQQNEIASYVDQLSRAQQQLHETTKSCSKVRARSSRARL